MMRDWADYLELTQRGITLMPIRGRIGLTKAFP